jgi:hypothetical protein
MAPNWPIRPAIILALVLAGLTLAHGPGTPGAALAALAAPAPVPAEVVVTLDDAPGEVWVGVPFSVGFAIAPVDPGFAPLVVAQQPGGGQVARAVAQPAQGHGHFAARLILPAPGEWEWAVLPYGIQAEAVPLGPLVARPAQAAEPPPPDGWLWAVLVTLAAAPAALLGLLVRGLRHAPAAADSTH